MQIEVQQEPPLGLAQVDGKNNVEMIEDPEAANDMAFAKDQLEHVPPSDFAGLSRLQTVKTFWKVVLFCLMVSYGATMDGYHNTVPGQLYANQGFVNQFGTIRGANGQLEMDPVIVGAIGGVGSACTIIGNLIGGFTADWFGRKFNLWTMAALLIIGNIIRMVARSWQIWLLAGIPCSFAFGFACTALVIYNSEIAPLQIRGFLLSTWALGYALGQTMGGVALQILATSSYPNQYLRVIYSEWVLTGPFLVFLLILPETPWHYARKGLHDKGKKSLAKLFGKVNGYDVEHEYALIEAAVELNRRQAEAEGTIRWSEMVRGTNFRRFLITAAPPMGGQLVGGSLINGYTSYFFQQAGLQNPFLGTMIIYIIQLVCICISFYTTDKVGRRPLFVGSTFIMAFCLVGVGIGGSVEQTQATRNSLLALSCIWMTAYSSGLAPVGSIYQGEASTPRLRAKTNSISQGCGSAFGLIFGYCTPLMLSSAGNGAGWGPKTGYFFAGTCSLTAVAFYFGMPEFKGRSYAELDELFARRIPTRQFATTKTQSQLQEEERARASIAPGDV